MRGWGVNILEDARHWIGLLQYNPSTGRIVISPMLAGEGRGGVGGTMPEEISISGGLRLRNLHHINGMLVSALFYS